MASVDREEHPTLWIVRLSLESANAYFGEGSGSGRAGHYYRPGRRRLHSPHAASTRTHWCRGRAPECAAGRVAHHSRLPRARARGRGGAPRAALDGFETRQRFGYLQFFRGSPAIHYEVWAQRKTARVEIGLHFEGERDRNYEAAELLAMRASDVQAAIGPEYELEEWTPVWTRLHRSFAAPSLTPELADEAAERVVALMRGLEPIIEQMELRT